MLWTLTKANHELSCQFLVRWWLRQGLIRRLVVGVLVTILYAVFSLAFINATTPRSGFFTTGSSPWTFLGYLTPIIFLLFILDTVWDWIATHAELSQLAGRTDVVLATRGEYRGGHPKLPRARFVYLTLGGSLEAPILSLMLPTTSSLPVILPVPVMDVARTRSLLTHVLSHSSVLGKEPIFEIEYAGDAGRKQRVELGHFFHGADEVYLWRNFLVCMQAEADTGEVPYGKWKSLPQGEPQIPAETVSLQA